MYKKRNVFFYFFYLDFVWQKPIFLKTKTIKIGIRECLPNTSLNPKKPSIKTLQAKQGLNLLAWFWPGHVNLKVFVQL